MDESEEIKHLFELAEERLTQTLNAPDLVPYGMSILSLIEDSSESRENLSEIFKSAWEQHWGPYELIAFCMHKLKWSESKVYFEVVSRRAIARNDWRAVSCLNTILEAFEDEWEDAQDFYQEYFGTRSG